MGTKVAKVPVVMQMETLECGAAALCMVLAYYGKWLPLEQVRADCGVSRDGSSAKNLVKAARAYGLATEGYRMEPSEVRQITFPAIIHWNFNHFVVLNGFKKGKAVLNDPARGRVEVTPEEFDQSFTGIVLHLEKTASFVPEGSPRSVGTFAAKRLRGGAFALGLVFLAGMITAGLGLITPLFAKVFMDNILSGQNPDWLPLLLASMLLTLGLQFVVGVIQGVYWLKIEGKLAIAANAVFMWHVLRLPVEFFSQRLAGDIAARQASNETIAATLDGRLAPVGVNLVLLVLYLAVMVRYSVALSLVGIGAALLNMLAIKAVSRERLNRSRVLERDSGKLAGVTVSGFEVMESIKAAGAETGFFERWAGYFAKQGNAQTDFSQANQIFGLVPSLLQQVADIAVLTLGVFLILNGVFTIGMLMAFQGFLLSFLSPVNQLAGVGQALADMRSQMERVEDVMAYRPDVAGNMADTVKSTAGGAGEPALTKLKGKIEIKNLTFGYNKLSPPLLADFSLRLQPGGSVALVGGSGSGKSTLAKLISGLYRPWSGEIRFDGLTQDEINREIFTGSLAVVDQDIVLFEDTVENNITLWDKSIPEAVVVASCKDACIHEDILQREGGYSHRLREGGQNFSGGQRQRLEIARALAQEPSILIMDEGTSALDAKTEQQIMTMVKKRGITLVIVAHRLSTIRDCDEIIVLDQGRVVERGRHEELKAQGGVYAELIND
jgi:NHLM bacteriocin system ABC transporter peptidase/ATP-binding protein